MPSVTAPQPDRFIVAQMETRLSNQTIASVSAYHVKVSCYLKYGLSAGKPKSLLKGTF